MTILQAIILGIVQGATEFLPVSSSGHLVLVPYLLGWQIEAKIAFSFNVLVQMGTLVAVIFYFWNDLLQIARSWLRAVWVRRPFETPGACMGWYLIVATIPAGLIGLVLKDTIEAAFASPLATGLFLLITATLLVIAERAGRRVRPLETLTWRDALYIGFFQAMSLFPGVSRSGTTITGGMLRDLQRPAAARFSFLMSIPVMLAAGGLQLVDLAQMPGALDAWLPIFIGFLSAGVIGYFAIRWLLGYLARRSLLGFAVYCALLGVFIAGLYLVRG